MTNKIFRLVVVFVLFSSFGFSAVETNSPTNEATNKVRFIKGNGDKSNYIKMYYNLYADLNLSEKEAIAIAEIILVKIYGERVLKQRPWIVSDKGFTKSMEHFIIQKVKMVLLLLLAEGLQK